MGLHWNMVGMMIPTQLVIIMPRVMRSAVLNHAFGNTRSWMESVLHYRLGGYTDVEEENGDFYQVYKGDV